MRIMHLITIAFLLSHFSQNLIAEYGMPYGGGGPGYGGAPSYGTPPPPPSGSMPPWGQMPQNMGNQPSKAPPMSGKEVAEAACALRWVAMENQKMRAEQQAQAAAMTGQFGEMGSKSAFDPSGSGYSNLQYTQAADSDTQAAGSDTQAGSITCTADGTCNVGTQPQQLQQPQSQYWVQPNMPPQQAVAANSAMDQANFIWNCVNEITESVYGTKEEQQERTTMMMMQMLMTSSSSGGGDTSPAQNAQQFFYGGMPAGPDVSVQSGVTNTAKQQEEAEAANNQ